MRFLPVWIKPLWIVSNPSKMQLLWLLTRHNKRSHITQILSSLHWLPIKFRVHFKILVLTFRALNGQTPQYITDLLLPYTPNRALRSSDQKLIVSPQNPLQNPRWPCLPSCCTQVMERHPPVAAFPRVLWHFYEAAENVLVWTGLCFICLNNRFLLLSAFIGLLGLYSQLVFVLASPLLAFYDCIRILFLFWCRYPHLFVLL